MPASRVTSRRLSAAKERSSSSFSAAAMMALRVASLRSSRVSVSRLWERLDRSDRELGRLATSLAYNRLLDGREAAVQLELLVRSAGLADRRDVGQRVT